MLYTRDGLLESSIVVKRVKCSRYVVRNQKEKEKRSAGNIKQNEEKGVMMQCRAWLRLIKMKAIYLGT